MSVLKDQKMKMRERHVRNVMYESQFCKTVSVKTRRGIDSFNRGPPYGLGMISNMTEKCVLISGWALLSCSLKNL